MTEDLNSMVLCKRGVDTHPVNFKILQERQLFWSVSIKVTATKLAYAIEYDRGPNHIDSMF